MLTAKTKKGSHISLLQSWSIQDLERLKTEEQFYCPVCETAVVMKIGNKRRWHFSHYTTSDCGQSEPESDYHLTGKEALYLWFQKQKIAVTLEPYIKKISQRPDLFLAAPHNTPIEFQCSTISDSIFLKRTTAYMKLQLTPIWILGGNRLKRSGTNQFRLTRMDWLSLSNVLPATSDLAPCLLYFCPTTDQFAIMSHILPISTSKVFANITFIKRKHQSLEQLVTLPKKHHNNLVTTAWLQAKSLLRTFGARFRTPALSYINKMLQSEQTQFPMFPAEAGLPVRHLHWIETPAYLWQTWVLLQCIHPLPKGTSIRFHTVYSDFQKMVNKQLFTVRSLPLVKETHYSFALMDYLIALTEVGVLKRIGKSTFEKVKSISIPKTMSESAVFDEQIHQLFQTRRVH